MIRLKTVILPRRLVRMDLNGHDTTTGLLTCSVDTPLLRAFRDQVERVHSGDWVGLDEVFYGLLANPNETWECCDLHRWRIRKWGEL